MKKTTVILVLSLVFGFLGIAPVLAADGIDISTLVAGGSSGSVNSSVGFTAGAGSKITGNVTALEAVTLGAEAQVTGDIRAGADFVSGADSIVRGDVWATGDVTLGAGSKILGSVHSGSGTITYGSGATVGKVK